MGATWEPPKRLERWPGAGIDTRKWHGKSVSFAFGRAHDTSAHLLGEQWKSNAGVGAGGGTWMGGGKSGKALVTLAREISCIRPQLKREREKDPAPCKDNKQKLKPLSERNFQSLPHSRSVSHSAYSSGVLRSMVNWSAGDLPP